VKTKLWIALVSCAALLSVPVVGNCWQSGRLRNQKSTPRASDTATPGSDVTSSQAPGEPETARPGRSVDAQYSRISWEYSLRSALKTASDQNKIVVVDVYADWCGWCKRMDRIVYSDPKVASLSSEVVFLRLNTEDRGEGRQFARQNHVTGLPTTIILDQKGSVINKITGYVGSPDKFVSLVERARGSS
jgi:thiol:disulfide interchange protein